MRTSRATGRVLLELEQLEDRFAPAGPGALLSPEKPPVLLRGDLEHDGIAARVVENASSAPVEVNLGVRYGTFRPKVAYSMDRDFAFTVGDFNEDGNLDLAIALRASGDVSILLGRGDGTFQPGMRFGAGGSVRDIIAADLNGNGHLDLLLHTQADNTLLVWRGRGDGTFQAPMLVSGGEAPPLELAGGNATDFAGLESAVVDGEGADTNREGGFDLDQGKVNFLPVSVPLDLGGMTKASGSAPLWRGEEALEFWATSEVLEPDLLLTSFRLADSLARLAGLSLPLADIFVVGGPGFSTALDLFSPRGQSPQPPSEAEQGGAGGGRVPRPPDTGVDESALNSFRMSLDALLRPDRLEGLPGKSRDSSPPPPLPGGREPVPRSREADDQERPPESPGTDQSEEGPSEMTANPAVPAAALFMVALLLFPRGQARPEELQRSSLEGP